MSGALPARLGKYEIRGTLGRGAMGTVYDGWDPVIERRVAIKTVRLANAEDEDAADALARFKREAQAAGRLVHPNIVGVFDYGETDELAFIVMEFVDGRSLKEELGQGQHKGGGRMAAADAVRLMEQVLAGLGYSHGRGVVHRDIKPANIMLTRDNQAKIADFGIARIESSSMTQAGTVMGTPAYMSPEQFMGEVVDRRTDIYSCGVVLFQLLTGERPFEGSMASIMHKATTTTPPRPSDLAVTAPPELDAVVARAMARRPADRFDTAAEFAQVLRAPPVLVAAAADDDATAIVPRPVLPRPALQTPAAPNADPPQTTAAAKARAPLGAVIGVGTVALVAAGALVWFLLLGTPAIPPQPAPQQQQASVVPPSPPVSPPQPPPVQPPTSSPFVVPTTPVPVIPATPQPTTTSPAAPSSGTMPPAVTPPGPDAPRQTASAGSAPPLAPLPPTPVMAPPAPAVVAAALAGRLPGIACSLLRAGVADGEVRVSGLVGTAAAAAAVRDAAGPAVKEDVRRFAGAYCSALDLLRALPDATPGLVLLQDGGPVPLEDNQVIGIHATMPGFAGFLHVAYVQHDEIGQRDPTVSPLVPGPGYPAQTYAARAVLALGSPRKDSPGWKVGPPFGTDLIVAVASTAPLFSKPPPDDQPLPAYLAGLQAAIDTLRRRGGTVTATAIPVDTRPGR